MERAGNDQQVGFHLSGDDVVVGRFIAVASELAALFRELEASVTGLTGQQGVEWQIAAMRVGSASLAMRPTCHRRLPERTPTP